MMLSTDNALLVLVDIQEKLTSVMHDKDELVKSLHTLTGAMLELGVPIIWVEQIPDKMGDTIPELKELLAGGHSPITKTSFSCCGEEQFQSVIKKHSNKNILLAGIEAHVCVYQTARDLITSGHSVELVADCTSSRTEQNRCIGINKCKEAGASLTSVETVIFDIMKTSTHPSFRNILKLVK